jgi:hypothetical protein
MTPSKIRRRESATQGCALRRPKPVDVKELHPSLARYNQAPSGFRNGCAECCVRQGCECSYAKPEDFALGNKITLLHNFEPKPRLSCIASFDLRCPWSPILAPNPRVSPGLFLPSGWAQARLRSCLGAAQPRPRVKAATAEGGGPNWRGEKMLCPTIGVV